MNESFNTICPNCFADRIEDNVCPACGYDRKAEQTNSMALPPFTMLHSRYLTGRIIGSGGFGITYIAYDIMSNKIRAVKEYVPLGIASRMADHVTLAETAADKYDSFVHGKKRFYEEAKVLYACSEIPDVVEILDYFQENNTVYFVMEYIRGVTLKGSLCQMAENCLSIFPCRLYVTQEMHWNRYIRKLPSFIVILVQKIS